MNVQHPEPQEDAAEWAALTPVRRAVALLAVGVSAAVSAGLVHAAGLFIKQHFLHGFAWYSREFFWMAPVAYGVVIVPGAVVLALMSLRIAHRAFFAFSIAACVVVATFGVLLPFTEISRAAELIVALGVGVRFGQVAFKRPTVWASRALRLSVAAIVALPVLGLLQQWLRAGNEARALKAAPPARAGAPNVLLVVLDAVRAKDFGVISPDAATTPRLSRRAGESVVFEHAYSVGPWSIPSHASMFTGKYAGELSADWKVPLDGSHPTLAESFAAAGYATSGFVANLHYTAWDSGLARGFLHYDDYPLNWADVLASSSYTQTDLFEQATHASSVSEIADAVIHPDLSIITQHRFRFRLAGEIIDAFLAWRDRHAERPFFAFLNVMDAHLLHTAPSPDIARQYPPPEERGATDYRAAISYLDEQLDRLVRELERRGVLNRTIVIITADHGELLGEHGLTGHAQSLYEEGLHVPLIIRYPSAAPSGVRIAKEVSLRDLAVTIQSLAGVPGSFPGTSLSRLWQDSTVHTSPALAEVRQQPNPLGDYPTAKGALKALVSDGWFYVVNEGTKGEELYHFGGGADPSVDHARGDSAAVLLPPWRARLADAVAKR